jgi:uncharacterized surface anchored protein
MSAFKHRNWERMRWGMKISGVIVGLFLLTVISQPLMAQSQTVGGTVVDSSGSVIPDATITIKDLAKNNIVRQISSDGAGRFQLIDIQPGRYTVTIEKAGFKTAEVTFTVDVNFESRYWKSSVECRAS